MVQDAADAMMPQLMKTLINVLMHRLQRNMHRGMFRAPLVAQSPQEQVARVHMVLYRMLGVVTPQSQRPGLERMTEHPPENWLRFSLIDVKMLR
jgi:hypothetical protein